MPRLRALIVAILLLAAAPAAAEAPLNAHAERARTYDVLHYGIDLRFDERKSSVAGTTTVRLAPLADDFRILSLDAGDMTVSRVRLENGPDLEYQLDLESETLRVMLDRAYRAGEPLAVSITYSATPHRGLYFFKRTPPPESRPSQFWSQGETNDNHYWFPCWDYPNDKATADVVMTINRKWAGVSNGELVESRRNADGTKTMHWRQAQPNATYLIMVAAGEFSEIRDTWRGRPVTYIFPSAKSVWARRVFGRTPKMMEYFSQKIGYDYPWAKYSQITVSNFMFGGMENTSATTLADTTLRDTRTLPAGESTDDLVAHELAHQWWGDLVTCRDWSHAWLNEGFATYFALLWTEHDKGVDRFRDAVERTANEYMQSPAARTRPLVYNVYRRPFDLFFDGVIYPKGAMVLHMLRHVVGDDAFWKGLNIYAHKHQFESVTTDDFRAAMEEASGQKLDWFFDEWTRGVGHPELAVTSSWDEGAKTLTLTVRQLQQGAGVPVFRMPVDVRIATAAGTRNERVTIDARENVFRFSLDAAPKKVAFDPDGWLLKRATYEKADAAVAYRLLGSGS